MPPGPEPTSPAAPSVVGAPDLPGARPSGAAIRTPSALIATVLVALAGCGLGATALAASAGPTGPPGDTIVAVTGDADNGFGIEHYDGSAEYPPTWSEARAECGEYDGQVDRVRCRAEVRTWYRDLAGLQQALAWAHAQ